MRKDMGNPWRRQWPAAVLAGLWLFLAAAAVVQAHDGDAQLVPPWALVLAGLVVATVAVVLWQDRRMTQAAWQASLDAAARQVVEAIDATRVAVQHLVAPSQQLGHESPPNGAVGLDPEAIAAAHRINDRLRQE